jgi:predicted site-specific integrase-resolvase
VPARRMGKLILVGDLEQMDGGEDGRTAIYARVSSAEQKADLDRQVARVLSWAAELGFQRSSQRGEVIRY